MQIHLSPAQCGHAHGYARAAQTLFQQGDDCDHVYELHSGIVRGVTFSEEGERQIVGFFFTGDQIGLPLTQSYRYSAEALIEISYVCQTQDSWRVALVESCRSDGNMLRMIGAEQNAFYRRSKLLSCRNVLSRTAAFLLSIIDKLPVQNDLRDFRLPQIDIANYLAMSPETVCRSLRKLRELRVIEMPNHERLAITDSETLGLIAHNGPADR